MPPASVADTRIDRVLVVHPEVATRHDVERAVRQAHNHPVAVRQVGSPSAAVQAAREHDPRIILIDLGQERALTLTVTRELRHSDRLIIGLYNPLVEESGSDAEFLRQAVRAGIGDFIPLPVSESELAEALAATPKPGGAAGHDDGQVVAFFGQQGGVGTTTLAVNTALALASPDARKPIALVDANVQFGTVAAQLGLAPDRDLADAVRELDQGTLFTLPSFDKASNLQVLASPSDPRSAESVTPEDLSRVLIELRRRCGVVVVDTAPVLDLLTLAALDLAETIVLVTEGNTPTVAGTVRLIGMLEEIGIAEDRIRVVLNRQRNAQDVLAQSVVAAQVRRPIDHVVPFLFPVALATHRGAPALFEKQAGPFVEAVRGIARDVRKATGSRG